jgi:hypothetical protein
LYAEKSDTYSLSVLSYEKIPVAKFGTSVTYGLPEGENIFRHSGV